MDRRDVFPRSLQYLIAIAEHGSFTRAAEILRVSQPTLSQQIKQLEESLQTSLLERTGRSVRLTDAGDIYLHHARRAWGELNSGKRAIHDVQNLSRGSLRLGWTPITDYLTCCLLEKFNSLYPGITLSTLEMPQDGIEVAVAEDVIDVGIAFSKKFPVDSRSSLIEMEVLFKESLCLAVGNAHPRAGSKERMSTGEFGRQYLALLNTDFALRRHIDQYCQDRNINPHIAVETNSLNVIINMVQIGPLATIVPTSIVRTQCGLYAIRLAPELPHKSVTLVYRKGVYKSPALQAFSALAAEWSLNRLDEIPMRRREPCPMAEPRFHSENQ